MLSQSSDPEVARVGNLIEKSVRYLYNCVRLQQSPIENILKVLTRLEKWTDEADRLREELASAGGIPALMGLFVRYGDNADIMVKTCNIITYMARNMACLGAITAQDAIRAVLTTMRRHLVHARLQARACNSLNNLAMKEENRINIAAQGGIVQILRAMASHGQDGEVQANGCNALWNLAICSENRPKISKAGGVKIILRAMSTHMQDSALFGEGCGALWNLADHPPTRSLILMEGGIRVILSAMERHVYELMMLRLCCGALESLLNDHDLGRVTLLKRSGGIALVLSAMRANPNDEELQSACCGIMSSLAGGDLMNLDVPISFSTMIAQLGAIPLILVALDLHRSSTKVQGRGCSAICNLSYDGAVRTMLLEQGAREAVRAALVQNAADTVVFGTALLALSQLTTVHRMDPYARAA